MNYFGIKELYGLTIKCTSDMEINGEFYEENEPIISFDKIQVALLDEQKKRVTAKGGYGNKTLILWEDTTGMNIQLSEGVISKTGLSILSNSKMLKKSDKKIKIPFSEILESEKSSDNKYYLTLKHICENPFVYRNGKKVTNFSYKNENGKCKILLNNVKDDEEIEPPIYTVYYDYIYENNFENLYIGDRAIKGFLSMTGRMRVKDDQSGKETTCLITFPKIQLMSDLTMRLGNNVNPYIYGFNILALPVGERNHQYVCYYTFLDKDIDSDIS